MFRYIKAELRRIYYFLLRLRQQGYTTLSILFYYVPKVALTRFYAKLARKINGKLLTPTINHYLIEKFHQSHKENLGRISI